MTEERKREIIAEHRAAIAEVRDRRDGKATQPIPRDRWPAWATAAAAHAAPEDKGVGDTVARFTAASGIKSLVEGLKKLTGHGCGCGARQERWNAQYPY